MNTITPAVVYNVHDEVTALFDELYQECWSCRVSSLQSISNLQITVHLRDPVMRLTNSLDTPIRTKIKEYIL